MNEKVIWDFLLGKIGNPYGVAGLMGNLYAESALNPKNLQGAYEKTLGMTDAEYTAAVDDGSYNNFIKDSAGYGLAQWTYWTRKRDLLAFAQERGASIGDLNMQLDFLYKELQGYSAVLNTVKTASTVREASDAVLLRYERPKDQSENMKQRRAAYGQKYFDMFAANKEDDTMAKVLIGSARIDENGQAHGGQAGDQTGKEVSTQLWYKHSLGWRVFRAKDPLVREKIGACMEAACANPCIGYDQYQRNTLYKVAEPLGFDTAKVATPCETDCSALTRVCAAFAGIALPDFNTQSEPGVLLNSGAFDEMVGALYTDTNERLMRGDILVTRKKGHSAVVLSNGIRADGSLFRGDKGEDVKKLQLALLAHGISVGPDGADGDFGRNTEQGVKDFQKAVGLPETGIADGATLAALAQPEPVYTVTLRHVSRADMESLRANWPQCEVAEE